MTIGRGKRKDNEKKKRRAEKPSLGELASPQGKVRPPMIIHLSRKKTEKGGWKDTKKKVHIGLGQRTFQRGSTGRTTGAGPNHARGGEDGGPGKGGAR